MGTQVTLQKRIGDIRSRILRLLWLDSISRFVTVCLSAAVLICLLDWWVRWDALAWRVATTAVLALSTVAAAWWCLWLPLSSRWSVVQIAARIEARFPQLRDRLSNALAFAEATFHPGIGSPALQQHLATETEHATEHLDFDTAIDVRHVRRGVTVAGVIIAGVALLAGLHRTEAETALGRLLSPLEQRSWPQTTQLVLLDPQFASLVADGETWMQRSAGTTLEFLVANTRGTLPADTHLLLKSGGDPVVRQELTVNATAVHSEGGATGIRESARVKLQLREGPVHFRAIGGDDHSMRWVSVRVTSPPQVESFALTLHPPQCLNQPVVELPVGEFAVRAVVGTRVEVSGRTTRPLDALRLHVRGESPNLARLDRDGRSFQADFTVAETGPGAYWFELVDRNGVSHKHPVHYEIDGIAERPPRIRLIAPQGDVTIIPEAALPLRAEVSDDFGIHRVLLNHRLLPPAPAPDNAPLPQWTQVSLYDSDDSVSRQVTIEHAWDLAPLQLKPGMRLAYHLAAADACTDEAEAYGKSVERTLVIVTSDQKAAELASREALLRQSTESALRRQQRVAEDARELAAKLRSEQRLDRLAEDRLRRMAHDESQVRSQVAGGGESIGVQAERLLQELHTNRLEDATAEHRYSQIVAASALLEELALPSVEAHLVEARRIAENARKLNENQQAQAAREVLDSLTAAATQQRTIETSLRAILELLTRWEREYHLATGLAEIIEVQRTLNAATGETGRRTFTTARDRLAPRDREQLAALARRQNEQAEALAQWQQRLEQAAPTRESAAARAELETHPLTGTMHQAAESLEENDISMAALLQQQILERLQELSDLLQGRKVPTAQASPAELRAEAEDIQRLSRDLAQLRESTRKAATLPTEEAGEQVAELARRQASLREAAEASAERLRTHQAISPAGAVARAAEEMRAAEERLRNGAAGRAATHQQEAQRQLGEAGRELNRWLDASRDAQREAASQDLSALASIIQRQTEVNRQTGTLAEESSAAGSWNRSRLKSLSSVREAQSAVIADIRRLAETNNIGPAERFAATQAAELLQRAAGRLEQRDVGDGTQRQQRDALELLETLHNLLEGAVSHTAQQAADSQPPGDQPDWNGLRAVRALQEHLLRKTARLQEDSMPRSSPLQEEEHAEAVQRVAQQQRKVEQLARDAGTSLLHSESGTPTEAVPEPQLDQPDLLKKAQTAARSAVGAMQSAADQLDARETGASTQKFQAQAVAELDQLLELAGRAGALTPQATLSPSEQPTQESSDPPSEVASPSDPSEAPVASAQPGGDPGEGPARAPEGAVDLIRRRALAEGVWGHLPPAVREQVLNMSDDRPLPAYEDLVRQYFETLAE